MAEPLDETTAPESTAPPPTAAEEASLQHATERLERVTEGRPARGARPAAPAAETPAPGAPAPEAEAPTSAAPQRRPVTPEAQAQWQHRQAEREARAERAALRRVLQQVDERLTAVPERQATQPAEGAEDPEPDFDEDPKGWYLWRGREDRRELLAQINPVLDMVKKQGETQAQFQQRQQEADREQQEFQRVVGEIAEASRLYTASEEGQGYEQRLAWYAGHGGDPRRGIPAEDGVIARGLIRAGVDPARARHLNSTVVTGFADFALQNGINPAWLVDQIIQETILDFAGLAQPQPEPQPAPAPAPEPPAVREVQSLKRTAASAASVAGSLSQAASKKQPPADPLKAAAKTGSVEAVAAKMRELRKADGKSFRSLMRDLGKIAEGERRAG